MKEPRVYGRAVTEEEFRHNPGATMREATKMGAVTIVDANGNPQGVISVPQKPLREYDIECCARGIIEVLPRCDYFRDDRRCVRPATRLVDRRYDEPDRLRCDWCQAGKWPGEEPLTHAKKLRALQRALARED